MGYNVEQFEKIVFAVGIEHRQPTFHGQSGSNNKGILRETPVCGAATLLRICQAMIMAMTMVFPEPVAILQHQRTKSSPSPGISIPAFSASGGSPGHMTNGGPVLHMAN